MSTAVYDLETLKLVKLRFEIESAMRRAALGMPAAAPADPRVAWTALVTKHQAAGLSKIAAIKAAAKDQPALYDAQCVLKQEAPTSSEANPVKVQWEAAIAKRMAKGMSRVQSIQDIGRADPQLYAAYSRK